MFYARDCPICGADGAVGFRMCSDGKTIVLVCDECDSVWLRPDQITGETLILASGPDLIIEGLGCSISVAHGAHWATLDEIRAAGLERFI